MTPPLDPLAFSRDGFPRHGFAIEEGVVVESVDSLRGSIASIPDGDPVRRRRGVYGVRNLLEICPAVRELAARPQVRAFSASVLGPECFAVRAVFFDKVPGANWSLGWHQDSVISVAARRDVTGFVGWSRKAGVWQVQPPAAVMERMVAVRVHLDDCGVDNGPLRVIPGTHRHGWVDDQIDAWKARGPQVTCEVHAGGVVVMAPLLLHASAPAVEPEHRRVIHLEYAVDDLPGGLRWNNRVR